MKLSSAIEKFKEYLTGIYSGATVKTYTVAMNRFLAIIGDKKVDEIDFNDVLKYKSYLYENQNLSSSVCVALSAISCFFEFLKKAYKISNISLEDLKILRPKVRQKVPAYLNKASIQKLIDACKDIEEEIMVKMLFITGMRASELLNLKRKDILCDKESVFIHIRGKGGYERVIPVDVIKNELSRYMEYLQIKYSSKEERLFPYTYHTLYYRLKKIAQRVGFDEISPHWLRHSCATELLAQGVDIRVIAEICGHRSLNTTMRYAKVKPKLAKEAIEKLKI
ncbi:tyrosine-type recombinase/integrase [Thermodesulfovibrio sp. TK110]